MKYNTIKKHSRTISGVTPVAVMTQPRPCPGRCIYCPTYGDTPQSYTPQSPAVLRAIACEYDPFRQVETRLSILEKMGHPTDKVELIIMGGTFLSAPRDYQHRFVKGCFDALNGAPSSTLAEAQALNERSRNRCVGLCIETRPDYCSPDDIKWMIELGATRVELGVQAIDDDVYRLTQRGHTVQDVVSATASLKNSGLKVHYHWMPNLPGVTIEQELELFGRLFSDERFRPDGLKIYPTMVVEGTELERWHQQGNYKPYDEPVLIKLIGDMKSLVPEYVRISRVLRDIPAIYITGGPRDSLRETVLKKMAVQGQNCRCIRCREYGHRRKSGWEPGQPHLQRLDYPASGGHEVFLSYEDDNHTLYGLLRLRFQPGGLDGFIKDTPEATAVVRELHVYGAEVQLGKKDEISVQHRGLGRRLLNEAERIASEEYRAKGLFVLSGVGARPYYSGLGYGLCRGYMFKAL